MLSSTIQVACGAVELSLYALLLAASLQLLARARWALTRGPAAAPPAAPPPPTPAFVTVQLPLRNERAVAEGALRAAAALDWPRARLEVQVLDDSDDETREIVDRTAAALAADGTTIAVLRREGRAGYKAGALAAGLARAKGDRLLVLDADFRPEPAVLAALGARLEADPALAFVQARWSFRNASDGTLTRVQAAILDALFAVEQAALSEGGGPVQFNGTGGLWRKEAIERAGGWATGDDALTEDLDLSFRAHEAGLRGVTEPGLAISTELPATMPSFRAQQQRWVRGAALTLRAIGRRLLSSRGKAGDAATMIGHLVRHARQPLFVAAMVRLLVVALGLAAPLAPPLVGGAVLCAITLAAGAYLGAGQRRIGGTFLAGLAQGPVLVALSAGLAWPLARAYLGGLLGGTGGGFKRTEKVGAQRQARPRGTIDLGCTVLALGGAASLVLFAQHGDWAGCAAAALVTIGCGWVGLGR